MLPILSLKRLSSSDFPFALEDILVKGASDLFSSSIIVLKKSWEKGFATWKKRRRTNRHVYLWADGIYAKIRLGEDRKLCLFVRIGVTEKGDQEFFAVSPGKQRLLEGRAGRFVGLWTQYEPRLWDLGSSPSSRRLPSRRRGGAALLVHQIAHVLNKLPKHNSAPGKVHTSSDDALRNAFEGERGKR